MSSFSLLWNLYIYFILIHIRVCSRFSSELFFSSSGPLEGVIYFSTHYIFQIFLPLLISIYMVWMTKTIFGMIYIIDGYSMAWYSLNSQEYSEDYCMWSWDRRIFFCSFWVECSAHLCLVHWSVLSYRFSFPLVVLYYSWFIRIFIAGY